MFMLNGAVHPGTPAIILEILAVVWATAQT